MSAQRVDVLSLLAELPELILIAMLPEHNERLRGVNPKIRQAHDAVRELVEAARGALDQIREDTQQIDGEWGKCRSAADIEDSGDMPERFYKLRTALARFGGTP